MCGCSRSWYGGATQRLHEDPHDRAGELRRGHPRATSCNWPPVRAETGAARRLERCEGAGGGARGRCVAPAATPAHCCVPWRLHGHTLRVVLFAHRVLRARGLAGESAADPQRRRPSCRGAGAHLVRTVERRARAHPRQRDPPSRPEALQYLPDGEWRGRVRRNRRFRHQQGALPHAGACYDRCRHAMLPQPRGLQGTGLFVQV
mmetsp:Transcript_58370/g.162712  ORF Transcript_58370/g.162712 Transcript_58370/m.162712 type:complete len:204 (+) Transcript_58370:83-694(+)